MNNEEKLELKILALKEAFGKRVDTLDEEVANLRVALTEMNQTLQATQQEYSDYRIRHPEEPDVPEEASDDTEN